MGGVIYLPSQIWHHDKCGMKTLAGVLAMWAYWVTSPNQHGEHQAGLTRPVSFMSSMSANVGTYSIAHMPWHVSGHACLCWNFQLYKSCQGWPQFKAQWKEYQTHESSQSATCGAIQGFTGIDFINVGRRAKGKDNILVIVTVEQITRSNPLTHNHV